MPTITINGNSLDPVSDAPVLRALNLHFADATTSDYVLIQTSGPLTSDQKTQLSGLGLVIHKYVSEDTYLCGYKPTDLESLRALPFITWANVYLPHFKIPASMKSAAAPGSSILPSLTASSSSRQTHTIDVILHDDVDATSDPVKIAIAAAAHLDAATLESSPRKVRLQVQERYLDDLAAIDVVSFIDEVRPVQLYNNVARVIVDAQVHVKGIEYEGAGEVVAVGDTGFDIGSTTNTLPAFNGRVLRLYPLGRPGISSDPDGHGTHVCGSVLGDGFSSKMGGRIAGTAPRASLVVQSLLDQFGGLGGIPANLTDLFLPPYLNDGARVHTNSWGFVASAVSYGASSMEIDDFVWQHPDMVICFAAGNNGRDLNKNGIVDLGEIGGQAGSKNCITVGASESKRLDITTTYGELAPSSFPVFPLNDDPAANHPEGMAAFSSRGPTPEGRYKPDVVAPGTSILSTHSRVAPPPSGFGLLFGTSSDPDWFFDDGTSMATPLTAGCAAVIRETLVKNGTYTPSAALIKALLINGATELFGQYNPSEAGPSPNNNSGFGRVNLANSVIIPGKTHHAGFGEGGPLDQGEEATFTIHIHKDLFEREGPDLKITLVWTDPAGTMLQNDLDLIVTDSVGNERHGNMGLAAAFDRVNNVEQVHWKNISPGEVKVVIRAFRITVQPQRFAYAWRHSG